MGDFLSVNLVLLHTHTVYVVIFLFSIDIYVLDFWLHNLFLAQICNDFLNFL